MAEYAPLPAELLTAQLVRARTLFLQLSEENQDRMIARMENLVNDEALGSREDALVSAFEAASSEAQAHVLSLLPRLPQRQPATPRCTARARGFPRSILRIVVAALPLLE